MERYIAKSQKISLIKTRTRFFSKQYRMTSGPDFPKKKQRKASNNWEGWAIIRGIYWLGNSKSPGNEAFPAGGFVDFFQQKNTRGFCFSNSITYNWGNTCRDSFRRNPTCSSGFLSRLSIWSSLDFLSVENGKTLSVFRV